MVSTIKTNVEKPMKLAILGNRSTNLLSKFIVNSLKISGIEVNLFESGYNQVEMEILNTKSAVYSFKPEVLFIVNSYDKEYNSFYISDNRSNYASEFSEQTAQYIKSISTLLPSALLFMDNFEELVDPIFGNASNQTQWSFSNQLRRINVGLMDLAETHSNFRIFDKCAMFSSIGVNNVKDNGLLVNVDIPYKMDVEAKLGWGIAQQIATNFGKFRKCLILDLDNTIWGGTIGDDGIENIQLGRTGIGKAFRSMQIWAKELKQRGIILVVCSKNDLSVVMNVFENHPEMILKKEDFSIIKANWNNKAQNIQEIKNELNIGFDSIVFVDDNPAERELVRQFNPEICVPEIPQDPANYVDFLSGLYLFDQPQFGVDTVNRTEFFKENVNRLEKESTFVDFRSFLKSLELKASLLPFNESNASRISELSMRSNQFNLRTVRYTIPDVLRLIDDDSYSTYCVDLSDKFGGYGIISLVVLKLESFKSVFIENWLMSCRAMQREVEYFVLNEVVKDCALKGIQTIVGRFDPTQKNGIVKNFYSDLGFTKASEIDWKLDVASYIEIETSVLKS